MSDLWGDVDALMRTLGGLRRAAADARVTAGDRAAIEGAICDAAQAIDSIIDTPQDAKALAAARSALMVAEGLIAAGVKGRAG